MTDYIKKFSQEIAGGVCHHTPIRELRTLERILLDVRRAALLEAMTVVLELEGQMTSRLGNNAGDLLAQIVGVSKALKCIDRLASAPSPGAAP